MPDEPKTPEQQIEALSKRVKELEEEAARN